MKKECFAMKRKILIVGGVAGGASVAARVRRLDENAEVIMFDRGPHVSFSNCSLPYHLSGIVEDSESLVLMNPEIFKSRYNIDARTRSEVVKINRDEKTILVRHLTSVVMACIITLTIMVDQFHMSGLTALICQKFGNR